MSFHSYIANILIGLAVLVMIAAIYRSNKLVAVLRESKVESFWQKSRLSMIALTVLFFLIMVSRLIGDATSLTETIASGEVHAIIMNATFLLTGILFFFIVGLDIQTFNSLFKLLDVKQEAD